MATPSVRPRTGRARFRFRPSAPSASLYRLSLRDSSEWSDGPPAEFIPLAEETGLVVSMGRWVLREGCRQLAEWREADLVDPERFWLSVNVSAREYQEPDLVEAVVDIAEGIETEAQRRILGDVGCPYGRGYHWGRPAPASEIGPALRSGEVAEAS